MFSTYNNDVKHEQRWRKKERVTCFEKKIFFTRGSTTLDSWFEHIPVRSLEWCNMRRRDREKKKKKKTKKKEGNPDRCCRGIHLWRWWWILEAAPCQNMRGQREVRRSSHMSQAWSCSLVPVNEIMYERENKQKNESTVHCNKNHQSCRTFHCFGHKRQSLSVIIHSQQKCVSVIFIACAHRPSVINRVARMHSLPKVHSIRPRPLHLLAPVMRCLWAIHTHMHTHHTISLCL